MVIDLNQVFGKVKAWVAGVFKSWTMWFNGALLTAGMYASEIQMALPTLREFVTPELYGKVFIGAAAVNLLLRMKTNTSLNNK